jgi:adenylate cyclase
MTLTYEQLVFLKEINSELDEIIESFQLSSCSLSVALNGIYGFLQHRIGITGLFIVSMDEGLEFKLFSYGKAFLGQDELFSILVQHNQKKKLAKGKINLYLQALDMAGEKVGHLAIAFENQPPSEEELSFELLNLISELLDSYLYSIHISGIKQRLLSELQYAFKKPYSDYTIDEAISLIAPYMTFSKLLLIYSETGLTNKEIIRYIYYEAGVRVADSTERARAGFDRFIYGKNSYLAVSYKSASLMLNARVVNMAYLKDSRGIFGMIITDKTEKEEVSVFVKDIWKAFVGELRQYLIDVAREKNLLRKHFSNSMVDRLLKTPNYIDYLAPRNAKIAVLFADISGFTKISEQILVEPETITNFINKWANGVVNRVAPLGACLDKLVGDCLIFLFGPPFYDEPEEVLVRHAIQSAEQIVSFTKSFMALKENKNLQKHADFEGFGVSIGINYCNVVVGLTGPNADLTAFGAGVNFAARLQDIAKPSTVLLLKPAYEIASKIESWEFLGPKSMNAKNVRDPLFYYELKLKDKG